MSWQHLHEHPAFCNIQHAHLQESQQLATDLQASKEKAEKQQSQKTAALNTKAAEINTLQQSLKRYA